MLNYGSNANTLLLIVRDKLSKAEVQGQRTINYRQGQYSRFSLYQIPKDQKFWFDMTVVSDKKSWNVNNLKQSKPMLSFIQFDLTIVWVISVSDNKNLVNFT